jgi:hypothetical protein
MQALHWILPRCPFAGKKYNQTFSDFDGRNRLNGLNGKPKSNTCFFSLIP